MKGTEWFSLEGKVALVTGSGRGIGRGIALCMAECGADVIIVDFVKDRMEQTSNDVKALGRRSIGIEVDVRSGELVNEMFDKAMKEFGRVDILCNNAGTPNKWDNQDITEKGWDTMLSENLKTTFLCTQAGGKLMRANNIKGAIINTSSTSAVGAGGGTAYGAAKAGVNSLTRSWANILAPAGIRVNAIMPGLILHPTSLLFSGWNDPAVKAATEKRIPLGRLGVPEDIGMTAVFLASTAASYITGQVLAVSGGPTTM